MAACGWLRLFSVGGTARSPAPHNPCSTGARYTPCPACHSIMYSFYVQCIFARWCVAVTCGSGAATLSSSLASTPELLCHSSADLHLSCGSHILNDYTQSDARVRVLWLHRAARSGGEGQSRVPVETPVPPTPRMCCHPHGLAHGAAAQQPQMPQTRYRQAAPPARTRAPQLDTCRISMSTDEFLSD